MNWFSGFLATDDIPRLLYQCDEFVDTLLVHAQGHTPYLVPDRKFVAKIHGKRFGSAYLIWHGGHVQLADGLLPTIEHDVTQADAGVELYGWSIHWHLADNLVFLTEKDVFEHIKRAPRPRGVGAEALTPVYDVAITGFCRRIASASDLRL